jgi:adenylyltransferase and sulfurtransferase
MLVFDGLDFEKRIIKLRPKQTNECLICSKYNSELTKEAANSILESFDYNLFCGVSDYNDKSQRIHLLNNETERISCEEYKNNDEAHLLIDVRPKNEFKICSLSNSLSLFLFSN